VTTQLIKEKAYPCPILAPIIVTLFFIAIYSWIHEPSHWLIVKPEAWDMSEIYDCSKICLEVQLPGIAFRCI